MFTWSLSLLVAIHPSRCQNIRAQHDDELYISAVGANWCCNWGCELGCFWKQLLNWVVTRMHDDELLYQWRLIGVAMLSEAQEVSGHLSRCAPLSWAACAAGGNLLTADWVDMCSVQCGVVSNISIDKSNFCATSTWEERTGKLMATIIIRKEITSNTFQLRFLLFHHNHCTAPSPLLTYRMHPKLWGVKRTLAVFFLHLPSLAITTSTNVKYPTFLTFYLKCNSKSWWIVWPYSSLWFSL